MDWSVQEAWTRLARSHRRLLVMVLLIVAVTGGFALYSSAIRPYFLPIKLAYYQYEGPDPCQEDYCTTWARLNHTIVVQGNQVNSFLTLTVAEEPPEAIVFINISFDGGSDPVLTEGTTQWTGEPHQGDSITVRTSISLPKDGLYFIWANPYSDSLGLVSVYQLRLKSGIVIDVSNASFENPGTPLEHRCLSNCWP